MRGEVSRHLRELDADSRTIGAVITGAGDSFCAGQDLNEAPTWTAQTPWVEEFEDFANALLGFRKPLVAAVNGVAAGGGFQMALMCDSRIGHPGTKMGQTEVRVGLASVTGTWLMERSIGHLRARELALSGRLMESDELRAIGFLNAVVPAGEVLSTALATCRSFAESPADSFARTKTWLYESGAQQMKEVFLAAVRLHKKGFESGVSQAGAEKFLQSRQP